MNIRRIRTLYAMLAGIPSERIDLAFWRSDQNSSQPSKILHTCGTTACAIGYATAYPPFVKEGFRWLDSWGVPTYKNKTSFDAVEAFFDLTYPQARQLFSDSTADSQGIGKEDWAFPPHKPATAKRAVLARIRNFLLLEGAITPARAQELKLYEATL